MNEESELRDRLFQMLPDNYEKFKLELGLLLIRLAVGSFFLGASVGALVTFVLMSL